MFNGQAISVVFENTIHALDLNHNLISIGRLDKARCFSVFGGGGMICLNHEGNPFLSGMVAGSEGTTVLGQEVGHLSKKCDLLE